MSRAHLLDVNVLIALFDTAHVNHLAAHRWFAADAALQGWRTCPLTESALLRILSHPSYPNAPLPTADLARRLEDFKSANHYYEFWNDTFSPAKWLLEKDLSPRSSAMTDAYLLELARWHNGCLATFDLRITPALIGAADPAILRYIPT